jgi:hypothetical protein
MKHAGKGNIPIIICAIKTICPANKNGKTNIFLPLHFPPSDLH